MGSIAGLKQEVKELSSDQLRCQKSIVTLKNENSKAIDVISICYENRIKAINDLHF